MELKHLLSVVIAALAALGGMLFAMGSPSPWLAMSLWVAAILSLVVTDFLGAVRLSRKWAVWVMWGVLAIYTPYLVLQSDLDHRLQTAASILICLQITLLFQEKDARAYGWLAVMSLLQAVVAARYGQGVAFGCLLIAYTIVGIFALSLLALYSPWGRHLGQVEVNVSGTLRVPTVTGTRSVPDTIRWPLAAMQASFASTPAGSGRSGVVAELFARLTLIAVGALLLAAIIFSIVPRTPHAWHKDTRIVNTVGFNDQITLGGLGETIESRQKVMQLKLVYPDTDQVYPMRDDIYLRGSTVVSYSHNHWQRAKPSNDAQANSAEQTETCHAIFRIGSNVEQQITLEPYLDRYDLFYVWPLVWSPKDQGDPHYSHATGRLERFARFNGEPYSDRFKCRLQTTGLVDGHQAPLVPASGEVPKSPYLQITGDGAPLPRLTALADRWRTESGLAADEHFQIARWFEQRFTTSGQFQYSLQGAERDTSIDAIEDFVSNHPRGHCEYFATALALMLRSQGIPSRVVLGYRCDEWHDAQQYYQVRQLHAHAWVEAFLDEKQVLRVPEELRHSDRKKLWPGEQVDWTNGGWLRLDPTPAAELGSRAADRTVWGAWENYVVDMDREKQLESVYEPITRAMRAITAKLFNLRWWRELVVGLWASLAAMFRSGIMGWLLGVLVLVALVVVPAALLWWLARCLGRLWRRFSGAAGRRPAGTRSLIGFYRRFEQIAARLGLQRDAGQTPREFAAAAGARLAAASGRRELSARAVQVAEAFYRVRFGRQTLDAATAQNVEKALEELES